MLRKWRVRIYLNRKLDALSFILPARLRTFAFFALLSVAWFNAAGDGPVEAQGAPKKTVLVL